MEQLVLTHFKRLPEQLQIEVLHYIQFLAEKIAITGRLVQPKPQKRRRPVFTDFHFPENGRSYSRSEIYGDDGR